ncbi:hypothetical protein ACP4OV_029054 [Aristida adscensionis]
MILDDWTSGLWRHPWLARSAAGGGANSRHEPPPGEDDDIDVRAAVDRLPLELLIDIHAQLPFLTRLAFASVYGAPARLLLKPEAPWLVLRGGGGAERATLFSLADGTAAAVRTADPAMRGHAVVGSSGGWLVTAAATGALRMANPVTAAQADLPAVDVEAFVQVRFGGGGSPAPDGKDWLYRKVVLAASPCPGSYAAAMLVFQRPFAAPAFATAEDATWTPAPSYNDDGGVEDAIHHDGRFYSIGYSGVVEAWDPAPATRRVRELGGRAEAGRRQEPPEVPRGGAGRAADGRGQAHPAGPDRRPQHLAQGDARLLHGARPRRGSPAVRGRGGGHHRRRGGVRGRERVDVRVGEGAPGGQARVRLLHRRVQHRGRQGGGDRRDRREPWLFATGKRGFFIK